MKTKILLLLTFLAACIVTYGQSTEYRTKMNVEYYDDAVSLKDAYIAQQCVLDIYYPVNVKNFATIVWFHGGGLTGGEKELPAALKEKGVCVIGVSYRLYPKVKAPVYIEDAAAAVSWVFKNIERFGGDPSSIFVSGHSAGGYLTLMIGLDKSWLGNFGIDADKNCGAHPFQWTHHHSFYREKRAWHTRNQTNCRQPGTTIPCPA